MKLEPDKPQLYLATCSRVEWYDEMTVNAGIVCYLEHYYATYTLPAKYYFTEVIESSLAKLKKWQLGNGPMANKIIYSLTTLKTVSCFSTLHAWTRTNA